MNNRIYRKIISFYYSIMTVEGRNNKIRIELYIYYAIRAIRGVQHAKPTGQKVSTSLKKTDKDLEVDIFTCKFQEQIERRFIEIQEKNERESLFIMRYITDFIDFNKKGATVHLGVGNKHSSKIKEEAQA